MLPSADTMRLQPYRITAHRGSATMVGGATTLSGSIPAPALLTRTTLTITVHVQMLRVTDYAPRDNSPA